MLFLLLAVPIYEWNFRSNKYFASVMDVNIILSQLSLSTCIRMIYDQYAMFGMEFHIVFFFFRWNKE